MELCARWTEVGAFYPFSRNHNDKYSAPQEPYVWPVVAQIARNVLSVRYTLLPYYYTLFREAHVYGATVARPLFFEFPAEEATWAIDKQFMIGSHLLLSPALEQNVETVRACFPAGTWYDWYTQQPRKYDQLTYVDLYTPLDKINIHIRGGGIIPTQEPALTTGAARLNPFSIIAALSSTGRAEGQLFWDAGDGYGFEGGEYRLINYTAVESSTGGQLTARIIYNRYSTILKMDSLYVLGLSQAPITTFINGKQIPFFFNGQTRTLYFAGLGVDMGTDWTLVWNYKTQL